MTTANDDAWDIFFKESEAINEIEHKGYLYVTANALKEITNREPRLLAKQDTLSQRPSGFKKNNISIFPVRNGEYILFSDPDEKSYYKFSDSDLELSTELYYSQLNLRQFDTYPGGQYLSESQAIDFAYISSLLKTITGEKKLDLVIRGRMFSGNFGFSLPEVNHRVGVSRVQIEVDAGYESETSIYLIEAKVGKRDDFHIRQLYYPFLEWSNRSVKRIVPIFMVYTNTKYYFYEFNFSPDFGAIQLVRRLCYSVNESPIADIDLPLLLRMVASEREPRSIPFPQANDLDKIVDLLSLVNNGVSTKASIAEYFEFDERQSDYYGNAGCYLSLMQKENINFVLTNLGRTFLSITSPSERTTILIKQLLKRPVFRELIKKLIDVKYNLDSISNDEISKAIEKNTLLTGDTPLRRASTVRSWLRWLLRNGNLVQ